LLFIYLRFSCKKPLLFQARPKGTRAKGQSFLQQQRFLAQAKVAAIVRVMT